MAARLKRTVPVAMPESGPRYELRGCNLELVGHRAPKRLGGAGIGPDSSRHRALTDDLALSSGLLFRALVPIRNCGSTRAVAAGIEAVGREEGASWLGRLNLKHPHPALTVLRCLSTEPKR